MKIAVIGCGYVGLELLEHITNTHGSKYELIGIDINTNKIDLLKKGIDPRTNKQNQNLTWVYFTESFDILGSVDMTIVCVPTPVAGGNRPDLRPLKQACNYIRFYGRNGSLVVIESTVAPGTTRDILTPILNTDQKNEIGIMNSIDGEPIEPKEFRIAYSPERTMPGSMGLKHCKLIGYENEKDFHIINDLYNPVFYYTHGCSIEVAEAAKIIENTQKDVNIAFLNEMYWYLNSKGIDPTKVWEAMQTRRDALPYKPGLVGGHCLPVDPYYLIDNMPEGISITSEARIVNEEVPHLLAHKILSLAVENKLNMDNLKIGILGYTYLANVNDTRNSKTIELANALSDMPNVTVKCYDYKVDEETDIELHAYNIVILAVPHKRYECRGLRQILEYYKKGNGLFVDIQGVHKEYKDQLEARNIKYWRYN